MQETGLNSGNQILIPQLFSSHLAYNPFHLTACVQATIVVPTSELIHIAVQVFRTHVMIRTIVSTLEHTPKRLHAVRIDLPVYIFTDTVFHRFMLARDAFIGFGLICVNNRALSGVLLDKPLQCFPGRVLYNLGFYLPAVAVHNPDNSRLAYCATPSI